MIYHVLNSYSSSEEEDYSSSEGEEEQKEENIHTSEFYGSTGRRRTRIFNVTFFGKSIITTVTSNPSEIRRWIHSSLYHSRYHRYNLVVGLGVQWLSCVSDDHARTLQICIGTRCLIIQLSRTPYVPQVLRRFLSNVNITFVGFWTYSDNAKLEKSEHRLSVSKLVNLTKFSSSGSASMENLIQANLGFKGVKKDEAIGRSNWDAKNLSIDQVQYATVDAHAAFEIGKQVGAWKFEI